MFKSISICSERKREVHRDEKIMIVVCVCLWVSLAFAILGALAWQVKNNLIKVVCFVFLKGDGTRFLLGSPFTLRRLVFFHFVSCTRSAPVLDYSSQNQFNTIITRLQDSMDYRSTICLNTLKISSNYVTNTNEPAIQGLINTACCTSS